MNKILALIPLVLLASCVTHRGAPTVSAPEPRTQAFQVQRALTYATFQGQALQADVYRPAGAGPHPVLLLVHGGGWVGGQREDMDEIAARAAARGYGVVNLSYRFAPAHRHPAQIEDVRAALRWARNNAAGWNFDAQRVGVWGYSAGAHLAALLGTQGGDTRVQAVVAGGLPADFSYYPNSPLIKKLMGTEFAADAAGWRDASPLTHVSADDPPFFLYHGTWDWVVGEKNAHAMDAALRAAKVPSELYLIHGYGHFAAFLWKDSAMDAALDFLDRRLR